MRLLKFGRIQQMEIEQIDIQIPKRILELYFVSYVKIYSKCIMDLKALWNLKQQLIYKRIQVEYLSICLFKFLSKLLQFLVCTSCTCLVKFILKYFTLLDSFCYYCKWIFFFFTNFVFGLLLMYRNTTDFCVLINLFLKLTLYN